MSDVYVYIYDISRGFARQSSLQLLGKQIDGIWHTGIVVFQKEIYFGSNGIESCPPEGTILGSPDCKFFVGLTYKTIDELNAYRNHLSLDIFHGSKYNLLTYNCNTFSNALASWLTGKGIPDYVINLPRDVLSTPFGKMIEPFFTNFAPVVSAVCEGVITYKNNTGPGTNLTPVYFKEPMTTYVTDFSLRPSPLLMPNHTIILKDLIHSTPNQNFTNISNELCDLLRKCMMADSIDNRTKFVVYDVLRFKAMKNNNLLLMLCNLFNCLVDAFSLLSDNYDLENVKCKLICNLIGMLSDDQLPSSVLMKISNYALDLFVSRTNDRVASSLIRNIILHNSKLDLDTIITIASALIHLVYSNSVFSDNETKENLMGTIYFLVKNYEEIKDLAKSYEINQNIRNETSFCRILSQELQ